MRFSKILISRAALSVICLLVQAQTSFAEPISLLDIRKWSISEPVKHLTEKGTIICRDPQIQFDEKEWLANESRAQGDLREHMLVDLVVNKRILNKSKKNMDELFKAPHSQSGDNVTYAFWSTEGRKCGNMPFLSLQVELNKDLKVGRYRAVYWEDFHTVASDWVE